MHFTRPEKTYGNKKDKPEMKKGELAFAFELAEWTGLEPATPGVTGRYSNQLNYHSKLAGLSPAP